MYKMNIDIGNEKIAKFMGYPLKVEVINFNYGMDYNHSYDKEFIYCNKMPNLTFKEDKFVNQGLNEDGSKLLFSFVSELTPEALKKTLENILGIINYNLEREMKENLLQSKIDELKNIFNNQSLDQLKNLSFDIKAPKKNIIKPNGTSENVEILGEIQEE